MGRTSTVLVGILVVAVAVAALLVVRGGSGGSDQEAVEQVMADLEVASREGDGTRICEEIFTPKLAALIGRSSERGSCTAEVEANLFSPNAEIDIAEVEVSDDSNATATVREANGNVSTVHMVKQDGDWLIRSVTPAS
jgi:hypothetical protein